ncbi:MAG TPA: hypothetical protein PLQ59_09545 [Fervidobacterium sp.]|nr:hypothetical protein [Fervidobacterium sp.]
MQNIINTITQNIEALIPLVAAIAALIIAIITQYKKIKQLLAERELTDIIAPLAAKAEENPASLLSYVQDKSELFDVDLNSNEGKQQIVASAAMEIAKSEAPKALKKVGVKDVTDMLSVVDWVYQNAVKPIVKNLKKRK